MGLQYTLPSGQTLNTVNYTLTNGVNTYTGVINVAGATSSVISFVIGGVAAGTGYSITLGGLSDDGFVSCNGSFGTGLSDAGIQNGAPFAVVNRAEHLGQRTAHLRLGVASRPGQRRRQRRGQLAQPGTPSTPTRPCSRPLPATRRS